MNLYSQIEADIKAAMLAKDKVRLQALRGIKKEFIEAKTAPGANGELSDDAAMKILVKMAKQRRESAQIYQEQNRADLAETELAELAVIEAMAVPFQPKCANCSAKSAKKGKTCCLAVVRLPYPLIN